MVCRIVDMRNKDVINIHDGTRLGCVSDVEVDTCTAKLTAIIIYGRPKLFGLFGHEDDCVICWEDIEVIGEDTILVNCKPHRCEHPAHEECDSTRGCRRCGFVDTLLGSHG